MDNADVQVVFGGEDRLTEKLEVGFSVFVNKLFVSKFEGGVVDLLCWNFVEFGAQVDAYLGEVADFFVIFEFFHESLDLFLLVGGREDGLLTDALSPLLIEVVRDSSHAAELWKEVGWSCL